MREIKFRGLRISNNELIVGSLLVDLNKNYYIVSDRGGFRISYQVKPKTVGEFTSGLDKKLVEIYEGDIMSNLEYEGDILGFVSWHEEGLQWIIENEKDKHLWGRAKTLAYTYGFVVGNIHQNPELLEGKANAY